jgi:hypothetical protein
MARQRPPPGAPDRHVPGRLSPTPERPKHPLIDTLHQEQLPGKDPSAAPAPSFRDIRQIRCYVVPQMSQPALLRLSRTASLVGGLLWACLAPVFVYADRALDKPGSAAFALAVTSMWLVGVASLVLLLLGLGQFWSLGRDRLGRLGVAGVAVSAFALAAMALGNGIELYTVTARGTESEIGHTIFLIALLILIAASILLGQILVRRRWSAGVRWAGLLLLLAAPLGILFLVLGGLLSPETDLGFWSALSVPYAIARVLLAMFAPRGDDMTTRPVATRAGAPLP